MARAYAKISFTPDVQAIQTEMGSRAAYQSATSGDAEPDILGPAEQAFIAERDSFYQATVSETGWPYLQHRGGPAGFLKILDERTIGYADFSGNRQYISVGNLRGDSRVSLLLMDYLRRQRLKIWGRARIVDDRHEPQLLATLGLSDFRAPVERGIIIDIEAFDWNCPKYITPRYSQPEIDAMLSQQIRQTISSQKQASEPLGSHELPLIISEIRQLTPRVRAYELSNESGKSLPTYQAGAHLQVPIALLDGRITSRAYSLTNAASDRDRYCIAVQRIDSAKSASQALHNSWQIGTHLNVHAPENYFSLHDDARPALLIAGGIGIAPIKAMAEELSMRGHNFQLHYTAPTSQQMAFYDTLRRDYPAQAHFYFSQVATANRLDVFTLLADITTDTVIYVCGPTRLIEAVRHASRQLGIPAQQVQSQSFI